MSRKTFGALAFGQALCLLAGLVPACTEDSPCDEGQTLREGYCYTVDASPPSEFGKVCASDTDCVAPAVNCAIQPGQAVGFCSAFGCDLDPSICPSGWGCMDLTPFGVPQHMCIPGA